MSHTPIQPVENYTRPFLIMVFVILFMGFFTLWAIFGYFVSLFTGLMVHLFIDRLPKRN